MDCFKPNTQLGKGSGHGLWCLVVPGKTRGFQAGNAPRGFLLPPSRSSKGGKSELWPGSQRSGLLFCYDKSNSMEKEARFA